MKILFFGTPKFAEIVLQELLQSRFEVVGVVCQNGKPTGRGNHIQDPHIVELAKSHNLPVYQFENLSTVIDEFKKIDYDVAVTASYGKFLPKSLLDLHLCINVHPSLLPKYRGATPIQSALLNGDRLTGVTIMKMGEGMDDGDIFMQEEFKIEDDDDCESLMDKLAHFGAKLLIQTLEKVEKKDFYLTSQDESKATKVKLIKKEDALLDFSLAAEKLVRMVKAYCIDPTAHFFVGGERIKVYKARVAEDFAKEVYQIIPNKKRFLIQTSDGTFEILKCQAAGGKILDARDFLNGYHFKSMVVDR